MKTNEINYFSKTNKEKWIKLKNKKVLIININWNPQVVKPLTEKSIELLKFANVKFDILTVPGSYEIPLAAKLNAKNYDGIIALGCVIKGDTYHFEAISLAVSLNISRISSEEETPIGFGVLMTKNMKQALLRSGDNQQNKGLETTSATLDMMVIQNG